MVGQNERAECVSVATIVDVPPLPGSPAVMRGEWVARQRRVAEFAVLETRTGAAVMIDERATRIACLVHGIAIERPRPGTVGAISAADTALLARAMLLGVARWEAYNGNTTHGASGDLCVSGLRHGTKTDAAGVPILTPLLRQELPLAIARAEAGR